MCESGRRDLCVRCAQCESQLLVRGLCALSPQIRVHLERWEPLACPRKCRSLIQCQFCNCLLEIKLFFSSSMTWPS